MEAPGQQQRTARVDVGGRTYLISPIDARAQFHVGRRLAPLVATLGISLSTFERGVSLSVDDVLPSVGPLTMMASKMTDEEWDYVIATALGACRRLEPGADGRENWAPVVVNGQNMYAADMGLLHMGRLAFESLRFSMGDFFVELLAQSASGGSSPSGKPDRRG